jgi:hypothetical protein
VTPKGEKMKFFSSAMRNYSIPQIIFSALYVLLTLYALIHFLNNSYLGDKYFGGRVSFDAMMDGTAWKPFVYRLLVPKIAAGIAAITPEFMEHAITNAAHKFASTSLLHEINQAIPTLKKTFPARHPVYPRLVVIALIYACLWGYVITLFKLARMLFPDNDMVAWAAPVVALVSISGCSAPMQYISDLPALFIATLCFLSIARQRLGSYLICFTLACLNKETAIFFTLFYCFWLYGRMDKQRYTLCLIAQLVIYGLIRYGVIIWYIQNHGNIFENHGVFKKELFTPASIRPIIDIFVLFMLLTYSWPLKPLFLKYSLMLLPFVYGAFCLLGNPGEYRFFFDIMPLLCLLVTHSLVEAAQFKMPPLKT